MPLGDHFSNEDKQAAISRQIKPGIVLYLSCNFTTPPKEKYLLLVSVNPKPLFFIINSEINDFIKHRPHLFESQIMLDYTICNFLAHNSYIDCTKVLDNFHLDEVEQQVLSDFSRLKDRLNPDTIDKIIEVVGKSKTLTPQHKQWIVNGLKP